MDNKGKKDALIKKDTGGTKHPHAAAHRTRSDVNVRCRRRKAFEGVARPPPDVTPRALRLRPVRVGSAPSGLMRGRGGRGCADFRVLRPGNVHRRRPKPFEGVVVTIPAVLCFESVWHVISVVVLDVDLVVGAVLYF